MERVDLTRVHGKTRHQRWRHGWEYGPFVTHVAVGELDDGRWSVALPSRRRPTPPRGTMSTITATQCGARAASSAASSQSSSLRR
jgi:hypothetical protein